MRIRLSKRANQSPKANPRREVFSAPTSLRLSLLLRIITSFMMRKTRRFVHPTQGPTRHEQALTRIAHATRDNPDTGGGVQLRRFLWSLYNRHHLVNLWTIVSRIDGPHSQLLADVLSTALVGNLNETDIKRVHLVAGAKADLRDSPGVPS